MAEPSWQPDPTGRHQYRWFDGQDWSDQVADQGTATTDPIDSATTIPGPSTGSVLTVEPTEGLAVGPASDPDRYRLEQVIASGGEGTLWKATITVDSVELPVAIKALHARNAALFDEWRKRWQAQSELLRSLNHANVVRVREVFDGADPHRPGAETDESQSLYLVMAWVEGQSLAEWVTSRPDRDPQERALIVSKLAAAIDYLHAGPLNGHAVLHRDIKPANVIINGSDVTLVDFGLIRVLSGSPLTQATGSPQFWAPEVALGQEYSEAADRYSLGATAYYVFTGSPPQPGHPDAMRAELEAVPGVTDPTAFADHLLSMLSTNPAERPANASAWARDLAVGSLSGRYGDAGPTIPRNPTVPMPAAAQVDEPAAVPKRGRGRWIAVAAVLLLIAGAAGAFLLTKKDGGDAVEATSAGNDATSTTDGGVVAIVVPDVVGDDVESAQAELEDAGLRVTIRYESSTETPGTVLEQSLSPGETEESTIQLVVSEAPDEIPDVVGERLASATSLLEGLGITVKTLDVLDEEAADGTVLSQDPAAGTAFSDEVTLKVARRPVILFLFDIQPVEGGITEEPGSVSGKTYTRSVTQYVDSVCCPQKAGYDLARGYRIFRATAGLSDDTASEVTARLEIFGDGRSLFSQDVALGQAVPIEIDVTGVLRLELVVTKLSDVYADPTIVWGDAQVLGAQDEVPATGAGE